MPFGTYPRQELAPHEIASVERRFGHCARGHCSPPSHPTGQDPPLRGPKSGRNGLRGLHGHRTRRSRPSRPLRPRTLRPPPAARRLPHRQWPHSVSTSAPKLRAGRLALPPLAPAIHAVGAGPRARPSHGPGAAPRLQAAPVDEMDESEASSHEPRPPSQAGAHPRAQPNNLAWCPPRAGKAPLRASGPIRPMDY